MRTGYYPGYRFPVYIISQVVWQYNRFNLSLRDIEELMLARNIEVSHETIRTWCNDFSADFADKIRKRRAKPGSRWHLDEMYLKINGKQYYLWRAVDQDGIELDILVTKKRDKKAAKQFFKRLLVNCQYEPKVVVTDKLKSYSAALPDVLPNAKHIAEKYANNRAENSHLHVRRREKILQKFKSQEHMQNYLERYCIIRSSFCPRRHLLEAQDWRAHVRKQLSIWEEIALFPFSDIAA